MCSNRFYRILIRCVCVVLFCLRIEIRCGHCEHGNGQTVCLKCMKFID
jgi:hypothetical protein